MYFLLVGHFLGENMKPLASGVSLAFAVLPYYAPVELSVAAQPLALSAFLSIRRENGHWKDWLFLALTPFYSSLYYAFFWFILSMGLIWTYDLLAKKRFICQFLI